MSSNMENSRFGTTATAVSYFAGTTASISSIRSTNDQNKKRTAFTSTYADDNERDFGPIGGRIILRTVHILHNQSIATIIKVLSGQTVESYRYQQGLDPLAVKRIIENEKKRLRKKYPEDYYRELIGLMVLRGYLQESTDKDKVTGCQRASTAYSCTARGINASYGDEPIFLPVPKSLHEIERQEAAKRQRTFERLEQNGVNLESLVNKTQPTSTSQGFQSKQQTMILTTVVPKQAWKYAVYTFRKKDTIPAWEASYLRFARGESPQTIAMSQYNGKQPIKVKTVISHLLDAITHGRKVDLQRCAAYIDAPTRTEWDKFVRAESTTGMDVTADPKTSGKGGGRFTQSAFLKPIVQSGIPFQEQADVNKTLFGTWCQKLKVYMAFRRAGFEPSFQC